MLLGLVLWRLLPAEQRYGAIRSTLYSGGHFERLDLSLDAVYDKILRLAFSGCVRCAHASPPCRDYSRLKLTAGHQEPRTPRGPPGQQRCPAGKS